VRAVDQRVGDAGRVARLLPIVAVAVACAPAVACTPAAIEAPPVAPVAPAPACPPAAPAVAAPDPERLRLATQLDAVDRELDAIDDALIANELAAGMDRDRARDAIAARLAALDDPRDPADAPVWSVRWRGELVDATTALATLEVSYGPRHPAIEDAHHRIDRARAELERHHVADAQELEAWRRELDALPPHAAPARVREAQLRARRDTLPLAPSDAPAAVGVAADDEARATAELAGMTALGPKHPDRLRAEAELAAAQQAKADAIAAAKQAIDAELALLPAAAKAAAAAVSAAAVSHRAELAARAEQLRLAYERAAR